MIDEGNALGAAHAGTPGRHIAGTGRRRRDRGSTRAASTATETPRDPAYVYRTTCGYCHGHNVGPVIRGRALPPETIEYMVRNGNGAMPAFRPTEISPAELAALAQWISTSKADPKEHGQ